jgi:hypothetical protein
VVQVDGYLDNCSHRHKSVYGCSAESIAVKEPNLIRKFLIGNYYFKDDFEQVVILQEFKRD